MSFLNDIRSVVGYAGRILPIDTEPLEAVFERAASISELINRIKSTNSKSNNIKPGDTKKTFDKAVTASVDPNYSIPVVYGDAFVGGVVTDAVMSSSTCLTMWFCVTICEKTGTVQSTGLPSQFTIPEVYWDGSKVLFKGDRFTVDKLVSETGDVNSDVSGLIEIYLYGGNSVTPLNGGGVATGLIPGWTGEHVMRDLVFAIVKVQYDPDKSVDSLGDLQFKVINTMKEPGDVLYDYMTNTRYGAGLDPQEIDGL